MAYKSALTPTLHQLVPHGDLQLKSYVSNENISSVKILQKKTLEVSTENFQVTLRYVLLRKKFIPIVFRPVPLKLLTRRYLFSFNY